MNDDDFWKKIVECSPSFTTCVRIYEHDGKNSLRNSSPWLWTTTVGLHFSARISLTTMLIFNTCHPFSRRRKIIQETKSIWHSSKIMDTWLFRRHRQSWETRLLRPPPPRPQKTPITYFCTKPREICICHRWVNFLGPCEHLDSHGSLFQMLLRVQFWIIWAFVRNNAPVKVSKFATFIK